MKGMPHTLGGMIPPAPLSPYARSAGMIKVLFPPSYIVVATTITSSKMRVEYSAS